jgi:hypothetical protein
MLDPSAIRRTSTAELASGWTIKCTLKPGLELLFAEAVLPASREFIWATWSICREMGARVLIIGTTTLYS